MHVWASKTTSKSLFLSGNVDKNRFTAETMLADLKQRVEASELEADELPI